MTDSPFFRPETVVVHDREDVSRRLAEIGTTRAIVGTAVLQGELQRRLCSDLDPPATRGFVAWARTTRSLGIQQREHAGWHREDHGISTVVNPDRRLAIGVATGDRNTGHVGRAHPRTKYPKGEGTVEIVTRNTGQGEFFPQSAVETGGPQTWLLLILSTEEGVWAELSLPSAMSASGFVIEWGERIVLGLIDPDNPGDLLAVPAEDAPVAPSAPTEVPVTRRSA